MSLAIAVLLARPFTASYLAGVGLESPTIGFKGPMTAAMILMLSALGVAGTLISDLALVIVDPRIRLTGSARGGGGGV